MQRQKTQIKKNKKIRSKKLIYFGVLVLILLISFGIWKIANHNDEKGVKTTTSKSANDSNKSKVNYDPPTSTDKTENDQHKDQLVQQQQQSPTTTSDVTPVITSYGTYDGNIEISSIVPGIIEDGGTCTLSATMGSSTVTKQVTGVRNAQDTSCPTFVIPRSQFGAAGNWTIVVKYSSSAHSGASEAKTLKVE